jgi:hypothetical protein
LVLVWPDFASKTVDLDGFARTENQPTQETGAPRIKSGD